MDIFSLILIALGLAADCFAVTLSGSAAMRSFSLKQMLRTALTFGFFQAMMPLLGWLVGQAVVDFISSFDHWIAFGLLAFIGGKMLWESFKRDNDEERPDFTRGFLLITLAVATSIDALAAGLTFAFTDVNIWLAISVIGFVAFAATIISFLLGKKLGEMAGKRAETIGGLILIGIGLRILITDLLG